MLQDDKYIINTIEDILDQDQSIIYFDTNSPDKLVKILNEKNELCIFNYNYQVIHFNNPYYPFIDVISDQLKLTSSNWTKLLKKLNIYHSHRSILSDYFCNKLVLRKEDILHEELEYSQSLFHEAIIKLLMYIKNPQKIILIIKNIHNFGYQFLDFLMYFQKEFNGNNIMIIATLDRKYDYENEQKKDIWNDFILNIESSCKLLKLEYSENNRIFTADDSFNKLDISLIVSKIKYQYNFLAIKDCINDISFIFEQINPENRTDKLGYDSYIDLLLILSSSYIYLENTTSAIIYLEELKELTKDKTEIILCECYRKMGYAYYLQNNQELADNFCRMSLKIALTTSNNHLICNVYFTCFEISMYLRRLSDPNWLLFQKKSLQYSEELKFNNYVMHILSHSDSSGKYTFKEELIMLQKAIKLAEETDNLFLLGEMYNVLGLIYQQRNLLNTSYDYFVKSEELVLKYANTFRLIQIQNSFGYHLFLTGKFEKALHHYSNALQLLITSNKMVEIATTLYNIAMVYFIIEDYQTTLIILNYMIKIMNYLNLKSIPFHTLYSIHLIRSLCFISMKNTLGMKSILSKIDDVNNLFPDEVLLFQFLTAINYRENNLLQQSISMFKDIEMILKKKKFLKYIYKIFYSEYAHTIKLTNNIQEYKRILQMGIDLCKEEGQHHLKQLLYCELENKMPEKVDFTSWLENFNFSDIMIIAKKESEIIRLQKRVFEIDFFNKLQNVLMIEKDEKSLITNIMNLIDNYFMTKICIFSIITNNHLSIEYYSTDLTELNVNVDNLLRKINVIEKEIIVKKLNKYEKYRDFHQTFTSLINIPLIISNEISAYLTLLTLSGTDHCREEDINILSIASKQITIALQKINLIKQLEIANKSLHEKNEFKSKYLANMSHEIRTPMNAIMGYNQQILLGGYDSYDDILDINKDIMDIVQAGENVIDKDQYSELQSVFDEYKRLVFDTDKELKEHYYLRLKEIISRESGSDKTIIESLQSLVDEMGTYLAEEKENTQKALQTSNKSGQYLLDLINSILDIAKIEAGKVTIEPIEVNLNEFMIDIFNNAEAYQKAKDKTDTVNLIKKVSDSITVKATFDPRRIKQVLLNLLSNAIKFTQKGDVILSVDMRENNLVFSVKDSGVGIKSDEMDKLFKEFERTSSSQNIEGTGLGLALSKKLVDLHDGTIEVESEYGKGSEFRVVLPV